MRHSVLEEEYTGTAFVMESCDIVVIGAGMGGASAACFLSEHASVVILEREVQPAYHTTGRSAAMFLETYGNEAVRALTVASRAFYEAPPEGFTETPLLIPRRMFYIGRLDQAVALDRKFDEIRALVPAARRLDAAAARAELPMIRPDYLAGAVEEPGAGDLDVHAILSGFLRLARRRGARLICGAPVRALERQGDGWVVRTGAGDFACGAIVNAAGAWGDELGRMAGVAPVGLAPLRRTAVLFSPDPPADVASWPMVVDVEETFYFRPEGGRLIGTPADETPSPPCDAQPEEIDVAVAIDRVERAAIFRVKRVERKWAGLRSFVPDRSPVIGAAVGAPGFFWCVGQGGFGIQTAPALGRAAATLALGLPWPEDLRLLGVEADALTAARLR